MKKRKQCCAFVLAIALALLTGCQQAPTQKQPEESGGVTAAEVQTHEAAPNAETGAVSEATEKKQPLSYSAVSTDGSVNILLSVEEPPEITRLPILEVTPHYPTSTEVEQTGKLLFGEDAVFYRRIPVEPENLSKAQIQEKLAQWAPYANASALKELMTSGYREGYEEVVQAFIEEYTNLLETAPETELQRQLTDWTYHNGAYYEQSGADFTPDPSMNDEIWTEVMADGRTMSFNASIRNKSDYKISDIFAGNSFRLGPLDVDYLLWGTSNGMQTQPTEQQIADAQAKAEKLLQELPVGTWSIDSCKVVQEGFKGYYIQIQAVPRLDGYTALRQPEMYELRSEDLYAPNFYYGGVEICYSPTGKLITFELQSPVDIVRKEEPEVLSMEALMERAMEQFRLSDMYAYGVEEAHAKEIRAYGIELNCNLLITRMEYGLMRMNVANRDDLFQYVPALAFYGNAVYENKNTGEVFRSSDALEPGTDSLLLMLNAVDGSIGRFGIL